MQKLVFSSDIDGVVNDYPKCFLDFIFKTTQTHYSTKDIAKSQCGPQRYQQLKHMYRMSEYKYSLPYQQDALAFYKTLNERNIPLIFSTSRPFENYPQMLQKTKLWLDKSGIRFIALVKKNTKNFQHYGVTHHIDDEEAHVLKLQRKSEPCSLFVIDRASSQKIINKDGYQIINSFDTISKKMMKIDG